jgi:hypothetical protein
MEARKYLRQYRRYPHQRPKSPCGCTVDGDWKYIVPGPAPKRERSIFDHIIKEPNTPDDPFPAYDYQLKEWFLSLDYVLPDSERNALICVECDEPTRGTVGWEWGGFSGVIGDVYVAGGFASDISSYREEAGLDSEWHMVRMNWHWDGTRNV